MGVTRLQKIAFLLQQEVGLGEDISFEPYYYGPFSREIADALRYLERKGLVDIVDGPSGKIIVLTDIGRGEAERLEENVEPELRDIARIKAAFYARVPLTYLLAYVYTRYPDYAIFSEIGDKVQRWARIYRLRVMEGRA